MDKRVRSWVGQCSGAPPGAKKKRDQNGHSQGKIDYVGRHMDPKPTPPPCAGIPGVGLQKPASPGGHQVASSPPRSPPAGCLRHRPAAGGAAAPRAGVCRGHPGHGGEPAVAPHRPRLPPGVHPRTCCRLALRCLNRKCTPKQALALPKRRSLPCGDVKWRPTTPAAMPWNTHLSLLCAFLQCERISISR